MSSSAIAERGLVAVPQGAPEEIAAIAHHRCEKRCGQGTFRELADPLWIKMPRAAHFIEFKLRA